MPNREALSTLDEWRRLKLDENLFRKKLHHFGGSFDGFYNHSNKVSSFKLLECNQLLIDRVKFILREIQDGDFPDKSSLEKLIERSWKVVPCSKYSHCKGHKFDPNCKHRK